MLSLISKTKIQDDNDADANLVPTLCEKVLIPKAVMAVTHDMEPLRRADVRRCFSLSS
jgi:hypothetical protein